MASKEHQQLAAFIKEVHQNLRSQSRKHGAQEAWKLHCDQHETLTKYADAMKQLATKYWDVNAADGNAKAKSRIEWIATRSLEYFVGGVKLKERLKEENKLKALNRTVDQSHGHQKHEGINNDTLGHSCSKDESLLDVELCLLDVGSCYNPFNIFPFFKVLPIDLAPASSDVYHCDFFNLQVTQQCTGNYVLPESSVVTELPKESFDIVVFSLLLEYIPSSEQRYNCCQKAYNLLKSEGLLFIITPDSKHSSANAPLMKEWRISLSHLGYIRVFYEKLPHIHCMAYRKASSPEMAKKLWVSQTQKSVDIACPEMLFRIPQDFQSYSDDVINVSAVLPPVDRTDQDNDVLMNMFLELPNG